MSLGRPRYYRAYSKNSLLWYDNSMMNNLFKYGNQLDIFKNIVAKIYSLNLFYIKFKFLVQAQWKYQVSQLLVSRKFW